MAARFNPPPGWPPAPEGWSPPAGWAPDPSWPAPPPGWQLWIDDVAPAAGIPGAPVGDQGDVARFAGPDQGAPTQAFPAQPGPSPFEKQDGAPSPFSGQAPTQGGFGAPSIPPPGDWNGGPTGPGSVPPGGQGSGPKQWLIPVIIAIVALAAIFGVLFATGVLGGSDDKPKPKPSPTATATGKKTDKPTKDATDKPTTDPTKDASDEPTDAPVAGNNGTRSAPLAPGEVATFTEWTVSMGPANLDAWAEISTVADEYYKPEDGFVYVMAPATVTFTGDDRSTIGDLDWVFVSAAGTTYDDQCGYASLPSELDLYQELYTAATATGNLCVTVPADQVTGGVWRVEVWIDDEEAYFGLS